MLDADLTDADFSDTRSRLEAWGTASVADVSLAGPGGSEEAWRARVGLEARAGETATALDAVGEIAAEKGLRVVAPLVGVEA